MGVKKIIGTDSIGAASWPANFRVATSQAAAHTGLVTEFRVYSISNGSVKAHIHLAGTSGLGDETLLWESGPSVVVANNWNSIDVDPLSVTQNTNYYLGSVSNAAGGTGYTASAGGNAIYLASSHDLSAPATFNGYSASPHVMPFSAYGYTPPVLTSLNDGNAIAHGMTLVPVLGTDFIDSVGNPAFWLCSHNSIDVGTKVLQTNLGNSDEVAGIDIDATGLTPGTVYLFAVSALGQISNALPVTLESGVPEIYSISDDAIFYGQTGVVLSGTGFGASGGTLWMSPEDDFDSASKVLQSITAQDTESITFDVVPGDLLSGTVYLFFVTAEDTRNADGFAVTFTAQIPVITSINAGEDILVSSKSIPILGTGLGASVVLADNEDLDAAGVTVSQSVRYAFSTLVIFDVVKGSLEPGTVYAFNFNGDKRNAVGFPVTLSAETMPESTVAAEAVETLPSQFDNAETTKGFLEALLSPFDEIDSATQYLNTRASFLHGAAGTWLDSEGQIIGAARGAFNVPENLFFTFGVSREGGPIAKSETQGFNTGYLRSRFGNELAGTLKGDTAYTDHLLAKSLATFRGTSLADIEDFVYDLFGIVCRAEFVKYSDVYLYPDDPLTLEQKDAVNLYAPVSAGSILTIIEV